VDPRLTNLRISGLSTLIKFLATNRLIRAEASNDDFSCEIIFAFSSGRRPPAACDLTARVSASAIGS
jgi:hypothetical protein